MGTTSELVHLIHKAGLWGEYNFAQQVVDEEKLKPHEGKLHHRTYRQRMAEGMMQVIEDIAAKRRVYTAPQGGQHD